MARWWWSLQLCCCCCYYYYCYYCCCLFPTLVQAEILWEHVCEEESSSTWPFCNTSLSLKDRVLDYSHRIPTAQKIRMMTHQAAGFDPLHIPPYNWWSEGLHGALQPCVCDDDVAKSECRCPTSFPCPSGLGNALNHSLWRAIGATIGRQARAITNLRKHYAAAGYDGLAYWSPTINLQRDPRWGRNMEVPGEDPLVVANYAREFVQGLQYGSSDNDTTTTTTSIVQIAACCKHLVANSLEGNEHSNVSRHNFNALISPADLANYYLPPFQACVETGALGIMCSYNAVNGLPSCTNTALLQDLVRDTWKHKGYIVSDCGAITDIVDHHKLGTNMSAAVALALRAGTDLNCGTAYPTFLPQALDSGIVTAADIDTAFSRLARVQMQLGLFDHHHHHYYYSSKQRHHRFRMYGIQDIDTSDDQQLALQAAQQSIVLLQNNNQTLPFHAPISKLAVIGPHTFARQAFLSSYHGERCLYGSFDCIATPLDTLRAANRDGTTVSSIGCHVKDKRWNQLDAAVAKAQQADAVVLVLGIDTTIESEGNDRTETTLPGLQMELLDRILDLKMTRLVVVLVHGGSISLGRERLERIPALLSAPYGGQAAAQAMADVIFGTFNPTGKLVATMFPSHYVHQMPMTEMSLQAGVGRTHMYYKGIAEFSFGHGLSYSRWKLVWHVKGPLLLHTHGPPLRIRLSLANKGPLSGSQTILLVWRPKHKSSSSIRQKLIGYQGSHFLHKGEQFFATFMVASDALAVADSTGRKVVTAGNYTLHALSAGVSIEIDLVVMDSEELIQSVQ